LDALGRTNQRESGWWWAAAHLCAANVRGTSGIRDVSTLLVLVQPKPFEHMWSKSIKYHRT